MFVLSSYSIGLMFEMLLLFKYAANVADKTNP